MTLPDPKAALLAAALPHVAFDGWSEATFLAAAATAGIDAGLARAYCPRGALDLALAYHSAGDVAMQDRLRGMDLTALRFRDRIAAAIRIRLELDDREVVRRGSALFSLPQNVAAGARAIWGTADVIWTVLGDRSDDINWYSKRAILSGVYASTALIWLGDSTPDSTATWEFLDRRIENVMQFEKLKASVKANPLLSVLLRGPNWILGKVHAPDRSALADLPGSVGRPGNE